MRVLLVLLALLALWGLGGIDSGFMLCCLVARAERGKVQALILYRYRTVVNGILVTR